MEQLQALVVSIEEILPKVNLMWVQAPGIARQACPGQFVMVRCGDSYSPLLRRPFSIHRVHQDRIALLFQVVGQGTELLSGQQTDVAIDIYGPLGRGFSTDPSAKRLLLIAGGIGIAPLVSLADHALQQGKLVTMVVGAQAATRIYHKKLLPKGAQVHLVTEDGSQGERGMVTDIAARFANETDQVFACGPTAMYRSLAACPEFREKPVQVSMEVVMGCGVGACYGCTINTISGLKQVCRDGPIFNLRELVWE